MGQFAEDLIDGTCCFLCGQYFIDNKKENLYTHQYPAVCYRCWEELTPEQRKNYQKAEVETF